MSIIALKMRGSLESMNARTWSCKNQWDWFWTHPKYIHFFFTPVAGLEPYFWALFQIMEQLQQHGTYWENQKTLPDTELTWLKNSRQYIIIGSRVRQIGQPIMSNTALNPLFPFTYLILGPPESGESHSRATVEPVPGTFPAKFQGLRKRGHLTAVFVVLDLPISATVWFDAACPFSLTFCTFVSNIQIVNGILPFTLLILPTMPRILLGLWPIWSTDNQFWRRTYLLMHIWSFALQRPSAPLFGFIEPAFFHHGQQDFSLINSLLVG